MIRPPSSSSSSEGFCFPRPGCLQQPSESMRLFPSQSTTAPLNLPKRQKFRLENNHKARSAQERHKENAKGAQDRHKASNNSKPAQGKHTRATQGRQQQHTSTREAHEGNTRQATTTNKHKGAHGSTSFVSAAGCGSCNAESRGHRWRVLQCRVSQSSVVGLAVQSLAVIGRRRVEGAWRASICSGGC